MFPHGVFRAAAITVIAAVTTPVCPAPTATASEVAHIAVIGDFYTTDPGSDPGPEDGGGNGSRAWPALAWDLLAQRGVDVDGDVAAEGGAGYGHPGNRGRVFVDLTAQVVRRNDDLVVFFGSRNDQPVDPQKFPDMAADTFQLARFTAPKAKFLVIGPPWPTASPPPQVLRIRDSLRAEATASGAVFVDPIAEGWFVDRPELIGADGLHPTDAGHEYMAERIAPLIYSQLTIRV